MYRTSSSGMLLIAAIIALSALTSAFAQEPINAENAATAPSPGHFVLKEQVRYNRLRLQADWARNDRDIDDVEFLTTLNAGVTKDISLSLRMPVFLREQDAVGGGTDREEGIGDFTALAKWRIVQKDLSALDTLRISLLGGAKIRTGDSPFTSDAYNPILGAALTHVRGRHGINADLQWTFTTDGNDDPLYPGESTADLLRYDAAYVYRLYPEKFTAESKGGLYAVMEMNGAYETNGDNEILISPGVMYEATWWTLELSVQLPALEDVDRRAEYDYAVVAGMRLSF